MERRGTGVTLARADSAAAHPPRGKRRRFLGLTLALLTIALAAVPETVGAQPTASEYQIKAAYLLSFAKFVKWPVDSATVRGTAFEIWADGAVEKGATFFFTLEA
jgi:hypothetical protein